MIKRPLRCVLAIHRGEYNLFADRWFCEDCGWFRGWQPTRLRFAQVWVRPEPDIEAYHARQRAQSTRPKQAVQDKADG